MEAVIFDMDGVLIDTSEYHYLSWKRVAGRLEVPFSRSDNDRLCDLSPRQSLEMLLGDQQIPEDEIYELLKYKNLCFMNYVNGIRTQDLLPGVFELLWELHAAQIPIGVCSSSRYVDLILSKLGISYHVEVICDGSSVERLKPHPDLYLCAASMLGVEPQNCIVIEEGEAGVQAGLSAEMCVIGIGSEHLTYGAHATFASLENVRLMDLQHAYAEWRGESVREMA